MWKRSIIKVSIEISMKRQFQKNNCYKPQNLIFQHILVEEVVANTEINQMRHGDIADASTLVDIQQTVENRR